MLLTSVGWDFFGIIVAVFQRVGNETGLDWIQSRWAPGLYLACTGSAGIARPPLRRGSGHWDLDGGTLSSFKHSAVKCQSS